MPVPSFPIAGVGGGSNESGPGGRQATPINGAYVLQNGILTSTYGTNASNAVSYAIGSVVANVTKITNAKFTELITKTNLERTRRAVATTSITLSTPISYLDFNAIRTAIALGGATTDSAYNGAGNGTNSGNGSVINGYTWNGGYQGVYIYGVGYTYQRTYVPTYAPVALPTVVTYSYTAVSVSATAAAQYSKIAASNVNNLINDINNSGAACTCNCNYCTCNCNYCTCNCNYACTCNCNYSDARLKENIKLVVTKFGLNVYSYNYLWDKAVTYIGVMAQELVGTKYATALSTDTNGYYMVDYSMLPVKMTKG